MKKFVLLFAILITVTACATVVHGPYQELTVHTPGALESVCYLNNKTMKYRVFPPETYKVKTSRHDLKVRCLADGNREKTIVVDADWSGYVVGNLVTGIIPVLADLDSGSAHRYSAIITVDFTNMPRRSMGLPAYQEYASRYPELTGVEEFRPGMPALMSDFTQKPRQLEKVYYEEDFETQDSFVVLNEDGVPVGEADMMPVETSPDDSPVLRATPKVEDMSGQQKPTNSNNTGSSSSQGYMSIEDAPVKSRTTTTSITPVQSKTPVSRTVKDGSQTLIQVQETAPSSSPKTSTTSTESKTAIDGAAELIQKNPIQMDVQTPATNNSSGSDVLIIEEQESNSGSSSAF